MNLPTVLPELIVVGAGPGDPELITLTALKTLKKRITSLLDNLINKDLLENTGEGWEKMYVGKQPYGDYTPQEEIHRLILEKAIQSGCVVRLKGGDPFIFGRGMEEILFARANGIITSYIPGITSMQAAGFDGIPLTHRSVSESVWFVTGTKANGDLSHDLQLAMRSKATVVIYMGMKKLEAISAVYLREGLGEMPSAIIQHASLPTRKIARGPVKDLPQLAAAGELKHPSIIIIGAVAGL